MIDYSLPEFLGIFLVFLPVYVFFTLVLQKGIFGLIKDFFYDDEKNFFHHHFHYRDRR